MILTIPNRADFISKFLSPVSKISNSAVFSITSTGVTSLLTAADNTVVLYAKYDQELDIDKHLTVNLPDLSRLVKILQCIDQSSVDLKLHDNNIKYSSPSMRFTYHLLEDGIISPPPISVDKIKQIKYDTTFTLPFTSLINLIKGSSFTININKLYISTKDGVVYAEINDKQSHNVDSISLKLCDSFEGAPIDKPLPISFETIRTLAGARCDDINVFVNNELNVMMFKINIDNIAMTYIVSGLVN
jgi:DNA polymerase III sliding clamp (beta) subunit (PCNA family)